MCYFDFKYGCGHSGLTRSDQVDCPRPLNCTFLQPRIATDPEAKCPPCRWHLENPGNTFEEKRRNFDLHTNDIIAQMEELEKMRDLDNRRRKNIESQKNLVKKKLAMNAWKERRALHENSRANLPV